MESRDITANINNFGDPASLARGVMAGCDKNSILVLSERFEEGVGIVDKETFDVDRDGDRGAGRWG